MPFYRAHILVDTGTPAVLKGALALAEGLHEMFRHTDVIAAAAYTMGTSCLAYAGREAVLQTNGLVFELYRNHFCTIPLEVTGNSPMPPIQGEAGGDKPRISSGSPTYPLDVSAALTEGRKVLTIAVVNPTKEPQKIDLDFRGLTLSGTGRVWRLSGPDENAFNEPGRPSSVSIANRPVRKAPKTLIVEPLGIDLYVLDMR